MPARDFTKTKNLFQLLSFPGTTFLPSFLRCLSTPGRRQHSEIFFSNRWITSNSDERQKIVSSQTGIETKRFVSTISLVSTDTNYFYGTSKDEGKFFPLSPFYLLRGFFISIRRFNNFNAKVLLSENGFTQIRSKVDILDWEVWWVRTT